jgi:hypothetical protein
VRFCPTNQLLLNVKFAKVKQKFQKITKRPKNLTLTLYYWVNFPKLVFPKAMSKAYKAGFEKVSQAADFIASAACSLSIEEKQNLIQSQIDLLPLHQGEYSGLRIDICLENPDTGETKWVDTTVVHTTCASYENKELKAVAKKNLSTDVSNSHGIPDALQLLLVLLYLIVKPRKWRNIQGLLWLQRNNTRMANDFHFLRLPRLLSLI